MASLLAHLAKGLMLSLLVLSLSGCFGRDNTTAASGDRENQTTDGPSDLANTETNVRITVPAGWVAVRDGLRRSTDIYATYPDQQLYAAVLSEDGTVLDQFDIENNAEQYRWLIQKELDNFERETRTGITTINGRPAVQYEIRGQVDGIPVVYLHTTVRGSDDYYQVVGWTTAERYQDNQDTLRTIIESFRGT